jgi:tetratricopeptide (TPR) repeat protein
MIARTAPKASILIVYEDTDFSPASRLQTILKPLVKQDFVEEIRLQSINNGSGWSDLTADGTFLISLLLISFNLLAAEHFSDQEIQHILDIQDLKKARVIPVLLQPCDWRTTLLGTLQPLPLNGVPVSLWDNQDQAYFTISTGIREVITEFVLTSDVLIAPTKRPDTDPFTFGLPVRNNDFTGRTELLLLLHNRFNDIASNKTQALVGIGGSGKTQLAIEYAHRYQKNYPYRFFVKGESHETLVTDFTAITNLLHLPARYSNRDENVIRDAVKDWLNQTSGWLLIFDNVENLRTLRAFLPSESGGHILLTTQATALGEIAQGIDVGKLTTEEGISFLLKKCARNAPLSARHELTLTAQKIVDAMVGLPLALDQAAAYIEETGCSLSDYLDLYQQQEAALLAWRGELAFEHPASVASTLSLAIQKVGGKNAEAIELLRFCAFLHPDAIPETLITSGARQLNPTFQAMAHNRLKLDKAIAELRRYSLLHRRNESDQSTFTIHRLVQIVLKDEMDEQIQKDWVEKAVRTINQTLSDNPKSDWRSYLPHFLVCATAIKEWKITSLDALRLLSQAGSYLRKHALYTEAGQFYDLALEICPPSSVDAANCYSNLGKLYDDQGQYDRAKPYYLKALDLYEQTVGKSSPETVRCLTHLGLLDYNRGYHVQAERYCQEALAIAQEVLPPRHEYLADVLNYLGWLYFNYAKYSESMLLYEQALEIRKAIWGEMHPEVAQIINAQAIVYRAQGNQTLASELFQKALSIRESTLGEEHPDVAVTLNDMAWLARTQGKYEQAQLLYDRVLPIRRQALGDDHPHVATTLHDIATLYNDQGKYDEAEKLFLLALQKRETSLGKNHVRVAFTLYNLGWCYYEQGKYAQAEACHQRALEIRRSMDIPAGENPFLGRSLAGLAEVYRALGRYKLAEDRCKEAIAVSTKILGENHAHTANNLNILGTLYTDMHKYHEARAILTKALHIHEQKLEPLDPHLAQSQYNLGLLEMAEGNYQHAETFLKKALKIRRKVFSRSHPQIARSLNSLAVLYTWQGHYSEAEKLYQQVLSLRKKSLGAQHPQFAQTLNDLGAHYLSRKQYTEAAPLLAEALRIREQILGLEHPAVGETLTNQARLHRELGQEDVANLLEERAKAIHGLAFQQI